MQTNITSSSTTKRCLDRTNAMLVLSKSKRHTQESQFQRIQHHMGIDVAKKLHPQCATWTYPFVYQKNQKRIQYSSEYPSTSTAKFWANISQQQNAHCQLCRQKSGYKIKCMYYSCQKFYHCTCAKSIGFIRDLESMRLQNSDTYVPPYCQQHLSKRVQDCGLKAEHYRRARNNQKASQFKTMAGAYQIQLDNMRESGRIYRQQQQLRMKIQYQVGQKYDLEQELSVSQINNSFGSQHPEDFYQFIFDCDYPKPHLNKKMKNDLRQGNMIEAMEIQQERQNNFYQQIEPIRHQVATKPVFYDRSVRQPRQSEPQQSSWNRQEFQEASSQISK